MCAALACATATARAQTSPAGEPFGSRPSVPAAALPRPAAPAPTSREAELEARVRQLEAMVAKLAGQVEKLAPADGSSATATAGGSGSSADGGLADTGNRATTATPSASGGPAAPGQSLPPNPAPSQRFQVPATLDNRKANVKFGPGFEIRTDDEEFILQFHNLTQVDYRGFEQGGQDPVHSTFGVPRQWFMFSGRITQPIGYFVSLAHGFDNINGLDYFADISYDPRFQLRIGRMKTPFT